MSEPITRGESPAREPPDSDSPDSDSTGWIDISLQVRAGMVHFPTDPPITLDRVMDVAKGDPATVSLLSLGVHSGTHIDAPAHFLADGAGVETISFDRLLGEARIVQLGDGVSIEPAQLEAVDPRPGERLLLKTRNSEKWKTGRFDPNFVHLSEKAAAFLAERKIRAVGIDYLSIGHPDKGLATHLPLFNVGACIIEGLDLSRVAPGAYDLICMPLRLAGADGAPARALVRPRSPPG